jgi:hypothetical protein
MNCQHHKLIAMQVTLASILVITGCAKKYETVKYDRPALGPVREFVFTTTSFGATNSNPELFLPAVNPEEPLAFSGHVAAPKPGIPGGVLRMTQLVGAKSVTCRTATAVIKDDDDGFGFRSEVKAPKRPGRYTVQVKVRDALLALGEINVRAEPRQ